MKIRTVTPVLFLLLAVSLAAVPLPPAGAQILNPVTWSFSKEKISDTEYELILTAGIQTTWHLYSQDLPSGGPIPTSFAFEESPAYELVGKVEEASEMEVKYDPSFDMDLRMYSNEAVFRQRIRVLSAEDFSVTGYLEFMCCNDQSCLPPREVEFSFAIPGAPAAALARQAVPAPGADRQAAPATGEEDRSALQADAGEEGGTGPQSGDSETEGARDGEREAVGEPGASGDSSGGAADGTAFDIPGVSGRGASEAAGPDYEDTTAGRDNRSSLWVFFLVAFVAGLAAILTPCVFPMIPMTVTFFMRGSENRGRAIAKGLVFGISVIAIYTSIGFLVSLTSAGADVASQISTHWIPNLIFFILFMIFAASFLGMFELVLPGSWVNRADSQVDKGGYLASFFMAFTLVLVSFSCTGPIVGALLVESVGGLQLKPILGMFGFSLAFALPFTLLAIFPSWLSSLPKSGGWLNSVKVVLGFIVLAFGMKFFSTIDQTYHLNILSRDVYLAIWIVIFTLLGFYLLGKLKLAHDSDVTVLSVPRLLLAIASFAFVVYMIPGLLGAQLSAISALIPPRTSQNFDITAVQGTASEAGTTAAGETGLCGPARYAEFLDLPYGLKGYFTYREGLECARQQNKPVLLDFKGHSCSNCKEMEGKVWSDPRVLRRLREDWVIVALYTDDRTRLPESEWVVTESGRELKTLGRVNAEFEMKHFKTNTQPLYALIDHEGNLLAGTRGTDLNVQSYIDFLDHGLAAFRSGQ